MEDSNQATLLEKKSSLPQRAAKKMKVPQLSEQVASFPMIPIKGLWDQATVEEKQQASETAQVIMQYWMGEMTKAKAIERLNLKPVRFWQISNQAVAGMAAGLLSQPRHRKAHYLARNEVTELRKKLRELELKVSTQQMLIEVLKSVPGVMRTLGKEKKPDATASVEVPKKKGVRGPRKTNGGLKLADATSRESKDDIPRDESNNSDSKTLADECEIGASAETSRAEKESR